MGFVTIDWSNIKCQRCKTRFTDEEMNGDLYLISENGLDYRFHHRCLREVLIESIIKSGEFDELRVS